MKAIIPVAGIGTRLRPHTHTQPKALVPVAGKPIIGHIIDILVEGGIKDFIFITGYLAPKVESYIKNNYTSPEISIQFVQQEPREGIGHSIWFARELFQNEKEVLIMLGDTILNLNLKDFLSVKHSVVGIKKVEVPGMFGVAEINPEGWIKRVIEKPTIPKSNLALVGIYKIKNPKLLLEGIEHLMENDKKTHGEFQLTDALMYMIEKGEKFQTFTVDHWYDCGKKESLLHANAVLLSNPVFKSVVHKEWPQTIIIPPVSIGKNCSISNSIIGPNVAIGDNAIVNYTIVKDSIIGAYSELESVVLEHSIIGNDSSLKGLSQSLNIGDNTEINFMP
ncbi:sugar phosphate nucleotidyltransferase [Cytophagales bacterium LB-30]|uniref:Sugar phosphate nucleotidyltransferase n=1 Tax=Shiella aurantiaca TaxID=3058365 RepID=A0ABT8F8I0_9BACT|nr:sugar phosphate nucleotidyltransferase [Shiella aurantiaca]MDN4166786.1 sugar phosphate nucleotidyltransferase [Shiella aurantiaca]